MRARQNARDKENEVSNNGIRARNRETKARNKDTGVSIDSCQNKVPHGVDVFPTTIRSPASVT